MTSIRTSVTEYPPATTGEYPRFLNYIFKIALPAKNINLLLTEREGRTGECWPEVVAVRTERGEGQYTPVRLELARLVSSLLYGTRAMLVLNLPAFENKKYTAYDRMAKSRPRKNQSEPSDLPCHIIIEE